MNGYCKFDQIYDKCLAEDQATFDLPQNPLYPGVSNLDFPVALRLALAPASTMAVDGDTNRVHWSTRLVAELSWSDARLAVAKCRGIFGIYI